VHGAGDRADWALRRLAARRKRVPVRGVSQGRKMDDAALRLGSPHTIELRVQSALTAVRARFGEYIATVPRCM